MSYDAIQHAVGAYYAGQLHDWGATARGVDWNSDESQNLRFAQLLKISNGEAKTRFSINDYGCGYGALIDFLTHCQYDFDYCGFDVAPEMVALAKTRYQALSHCRFVESELLLPLADFTVASGIFNVRLQTSDEEWLSYMLETLACIDRHSRLGFAFNVLTSYSDEEKKRPDLYYADPCLLFGYCKTQFSRQVALLHDYGLYEFTILVRKQL